MFCRQTPILQSETIVLGKPKSVDVHCVNSVVNLRMSQMDGVREQLNDRIVLDLLRTVDADGTRSQRRIAAELGIALGLVNVYLKRSVKMGLVKVRQAPARRYAYYLTPKGFSEKSRLTVEYLSRSFSFFREAKNDFAAIFAQAEGRGLSRLVVLGLSDLSEIALLCAVDRPIAIVAIVDADATTERFAGVLVAKHVDDIDQGFDAVVVADMRAAKGLMDAAIVRFGKDRVFAPALLGLRENVNEIVS